VSAEPGTGLWSLARYKVYGIALILIVVAGAALSAAAYNRAFTSSLPVTLRADRSGLQMHPGNRVKIRGVDLGLVHSVALDPDGSGVDINLDLDPTLARQVPVNVHAELAQLTAFGNKTVQLEFPPNPSTQTLRAGSVIRTRQVSTEINDVFQQLTTVLDEVHPEQLNATLGAFAGALRGRGDQLGRTVVDANNYLARFNGDLPQLRQDFHKGAQVANLYADASPDLLRLLGNSTVTARTLADKRSDLHGMLSSLDGFGRSGDDFFDQNAGPLSAMLASLRPTTSLLHEYAPMLTCTLKGAAFADEQEQRGLFTGGFVHFEAMFTPGGGEYQNPTDLPTAGPGPDAGPNCHGLPYIAPGHESVVNSLPGNPKVADRRPGNSNTPQLARQPLVVQLFGPQALLPPALKGGK
jgi:phospholipid/cholesterol/gamma-HCH transport system substrate-binding protein